MPSTELNWRIKLAVRTQKWLSLGVVLATCMLVVATVALLCGLGSVVWFYVYNGVRALLGVG
jgi:nitrate reductase NapE component